MAERIAGAILAGGKASRLGGVTKGLLQLDSGKTLIERLADQMRDARLAEVVICADDSEPYEHFGLEIVPDLHPDLGPLGGIEAALTHYADRADAVCFCPCDLPGMSGVQIATLMRAFAERPEGVGVVYVQTGDFFWHPLCCVVHNALLGSISQAIEQGSLSVRQVWTRLDALGVAFDDPAPFFNVNTPEDLARWKGGLKL